MYTERVYISIVSLFIENCFFFPSWEGGGKIIYQLCVSAMVNELLIQSNYFF